MNDTKNSGNRPIEQQRDEAIKKLEANYAHGNIDLEEFEKRLELAVNATTNEELTNITSGLEMIQEKSENSFTYSINTENVRSDEILTGILSGVKRKGRWRPARNNRMFVFMGGIDLDFSDAVLPPGETDFEFFCVMGGIDIIVPKGINVEASGLPIMGGIDNRVPDEHYPGCPTLRFHGITLMGGVDVKPPKIKKRRRKK